MKRNRVPALLAHAALAALTPALSGCYDDLAPEDYYRFLSDVADRSYAAAGTEIELLQLPEATGGTTPLTYALAPDIPGLIFDPATRTLTGTPAEVGTYGMSYQAIAADSDSAIRAELLFRITIDGTLGFASSVDDRDYETGGEIEPLRLPAATGGTPPLAYTLSPEVPGLAFNPHTRTLTGTPAGFLGGLGYRVTYTATDAGGAIGALRFWIGFHWSLRFTASVDDWQYRREIEIEPLRLPAATGGTPPLAYTLSPEVPGLAFDPHTRTLTGTPAEVGTYDATYVATDSDGATGVLRFTISVGSRYS